MKKIELKRAEDVPVSNMARVIAVAMLKEHGEYKCTVDGKKYHFVVA